MKVLMCARQFPAGHPRKGEPTWFVEKIWKSIWDDYKGCNNPLYTYWNRYDEAFPCGADPLENIHQHQPKHTTIRGGSRWKAGDMASLRVWSGLPYRSKQIEFAQVEVKRTWEFRILFEPFHKAIFYLNGNELPVTAICQIAKNDGLSEQDFFDWFKIHPKSKSFEFTGQVISWSSVIDYTSLTEKTNA